MVNASSTEDTIKAQSRKELESLRQQVSELTGQLQRHVSGSAGAALKRAGDAASKMMSGVDAKGRQAVEGVQEIKDNLAGAVDTSLKNRPYATLAMAFGIGFFLARLS